MSTLELEPNMVRMHDANGKDYAMVFEPGNRLHGWIFYQHPDRKWVTLRPATPDELALAPQVTLQKGTNK